MLGTFKSKLPSVFRRAADDAGKKAAAPASEAALTVRNIAPMPPPPKVSAKEAWDVISPYFVSSPGRWKGRLLLGTILGVTVAQVGTEVLLNHWSNDFFSQIQNLIKDPAGDATPIYMSLLRYGGIAGGLLGMNALRQNLQSNLQLNWRKSMNEQYVDKWMNDRAYLRLQTSENPLDNPDQRLFEDINLMTSDVISLGCGFINAAVTFPAFAFVLWELSGTLNLNLAGHHLAIPGFLMFGAIAYAAAGTYAARAIGKPLIGLHYNQQKLETSLRNGTGHIRNNSESIALYNGEKAEKRALGVRIDRIAENSGRINIKETHLTVMRDVHGRVGYVMPYMLMLPNVFAGGAKWGDLAQGAHAMGQVQSSLSWLFYSYSSIARIQAMVSRISSFDKAVIDSRKTEMTRYPDRTQGVQLELGL